MDFWKAKEREASLGGGGDRAQPRITTALSPAVNPDSRKAAQPEKSSTVGTQRKRKEKKKKKTPRELLARAD